MWQYFRNRANWLSMSARGFPVVSRNKAAKYSVTGLSILVERRVPPGILVDGKRIRANDWLKPSIMVTSPWATCSLSILFLSSFGSVKAWINLYIGQFKHIKCLKYAASLFFFVYTSIYQCARELQKQMEGIGWFGRQLFSAVGPFPFHRPCNNRCSQGEVIKNTVKASQLLLSPLCPFSCQRKYRQ